MKLITIIPDELFSIFKKHGIMAFDYLNEYDKDQTAIAIAHAVPYNPSGDCISREALKEQVKNEVCEVCFDSPDERQCSPNCKLCTFKQLIDNAPTVNTNVVADDVIKAHENIGYEQGFNDGYAKCVTDNERPQGDCISREAVRSEIWKERVEKDEGCNSEYIRGLKTAIGFINNAQAVEAYTPEQVNELVDLNKKLPEEKPKGKWINHRNDCGHNIADCSLCGKTMQWHDEDGDGIPRYCWYCGADMRTKENENG